MRYLFLFKKIMKEQLHYHFIIKKMIHGSMRYLFTSEKITQRLFFVHPVLVPGGKHLAQAFR